MNEYIWINEGGETCCGKRSDHGGITLMAAVEQKEWKPIVGDDDEAVELLTDRNHWIGFPVGTLSTVFGQSSEIVCEYCNHKTKEVAA
jgi:hypothetical protein